MKSILQEVKPLVIEAEANNSVIDAFGMAHSFLWVLVYI